MTDIAARLKSLDIVLPTAAAPVAAYVPAVEHNGLLYLSGQLPFERGELMTGRVGDDRDTAYGAKAARACAVMILAQIAKAASLDRVARIVRLGVFVASSDRFTDQPKVANGASELMEQVFGDIGRHARSAVGVPVLPLGAAVEIDAVIALRPA